MITIKTQIYDDFHCIADQCPMTCCQGWSIKVDKENLREMAESWGYGLFNGIYHST